MKITTNSILELRTKYLKNNKLISIIYIPRFCDNSELLTHPVTSKKPGSDECRVYGISVITDRSEFTNNMRVVYESSEVIPYE